MSVTEVARALLAGEVAIVPTDTVYGLAAIPTNPDAVAQLFALKTRPADKAIPVLAPSLDALASIARMDDRALALAERFWPGALTIVVPRFEGFTADLGGTGDGTIAVRIPARPNLLALLETTGPLAVTSANASGQEPAANAADASNLWPELVVLDDGPATDRASTVVSLIGSPQILRAGSLPDELVLSALEG